MCCWERSGAGSTGSDRWPLILAVHIVHKPRCWVRPVIGWIDASQAGKCNVPISNVHELVIGRAAYSCRQQTTRHEREGPRAPFPAQTLHMHDHKPIEP